ncbi:hypothetical protein BDP27DRAFT_1421549 [Rhodocollybia butyracea]|uniref:Uncharacterized protein n=1 Tax=Rhodocollybia butyracea TaxID=206335 RepID=A0A9P5PUU5_9AGAR|nr:hypothetical protein BDP27DRAFT_1421549 [Rhodocollybia butyracea]
MSWQFFLHLAGQAIFFAVQIPESALSHPIPSLRASPSRPYTLYFDCTSTLALMSCLALSVFVNAAPQPVFHDSQISARSLDQPLSLSRRAEVTPAVTPAEVESTPAGVPLTPAEALAAGFSVAPTFSCSTGVKPADWIRIKDNIRTLFSGLKEQLGIKKQLELREEYLMYIPSGQYPRKCGSVSRQRYLTFVGPAVCEGTCSVFIYRKDRAETATIRSATGKNIVKLILRYPILP